MGYHGVSGWPIEYTDPPKITEQFVYWKTCCKVYSFVNFTKVTIGSVLQR